MRVDLLTTWGLLIALGCGSSDRASPYVGGFGSGGQAARSGGASNQGGEGGESSGGTVGLGGGESGGTGGESGSAGAPGTGGTEGDACPSDDAAVPTNISFVCPHAPQVNVMPSPLLDEGSGFLVSATPDGTSLLWGKLGSSEVLYQLSERDDAAAPFGPATPLIVNGTPIALSPNGLRLALLSPDGSALTEIVRPSKADPFGTPTEGAFSELNLSAEDSQNLFMDVVYGPDDRSLVYLTYRLTDSAMELRISAREPDAFWPQGRLQSGCEWDAKRGLARRPKSLSSDGLTLFYFDEVRSQLRAAYRRNMNEPFRWFVDVLENDELLVHSDCSQTYVARPLGDDILRAGTLTEAE